MTALDEALEQLDALVSRNGGSGCFFVLMPEYRPDLSKLFAHRLGLRMFDYRAIVMASYGADANRIPLHDLTDRLQQEAVDEGILAHNVEALLATKTEPERQRWLSEVMSAAWSNPMLIPLTLFTRDAPAESGRVLDLREVTFEDQGLISRLLH